MMPRRERDPSLTVALLDHRPLALEAVATFIESIDGVGRVDRILSPVRALQQALSEPYSCLILNLSRSSSGDTPALLRAVKRIAPELPLVVLTEQLEPGVVMRLLRGGVRAVLSLTSSPQDLSEAIHAASDGRCFVSGDSAAETIRYIQDHASEADLSERAREVLVLAARGLNTAQIAYEMSCGLSTAKRLLRAAYDHLGAKDRAEAIRLARQRGLVDGEDQAD
jgi:two-component system, NarL family, invasion response regulator UvrY